MIGVHDLFERFAMSDSGMYVKLGMRTRHVVQGFGTMVFRMESGDVLWVPGVCSQPQRLRSRESERKALQIIQISDLSHLI
jgi:hypothetical protein